MVELLLPEVWLQLLSVDHTKMSAEDGLRVCSVALIWVRGQLASDSTFLDFTHAETLCQETICGTHVP